tara:strand:+ start:1516 stop:2868 length:1353 start_codon:yes stop_codon:yes gene_type:complete
MQFKNSYKNQFGNFYRRKKTFSFSFSLISLLLVFSLYIIFFAINDLTSLSNNPIEASSYQNAYDLYDENLEKKVDDYRTIYSKEYSYINKEDFEDYSHPEPVSVKMRVNRIYDLDEITQTFIASGTIEARWNDGAIQKFDIDDNSYNLHELAQKDVLASAQLSFFNAEDQIYEKVNLVNNPKVNGEGYQNFSKYKFKGRFLMDRNMRKFPFDSAFLRIRMTHELLAPDIWLRSDEDSLSIEPNYRLNAYVYKATKCYEDSKDENGEYFRNPTKYDCIYDEIQPLLTFAEDFQESSEVSDKFMDLWTELDYQPSILFRAYMERSISSSFFRYLLPLLFGIIVLTFNEFISNQFREIRIATPPTILLTFIFMQSGFHSEIPQISYVTFLDRVYFLCYLLAVISMINAVLAGTKRNKMRRYFYKIFHIPLSIVLRKIYFLIAIFGPFAAYFIP